MKLFALASLGLASANTTEWIMENWWNEAKNVFNFASSNFDSFKAAVDSVPQSKWDPLWNFCNADGSSEISQAELVGCGKKAAAFADMPEEYQNHLYNFAAKYWNTIDMDGNGALSSDEYKYTMAGFAGTDARVIMKGFDADKNGLLDSDEINAWKSFVQTVMASWNWEMTGDHVEALKGAWMDAQVNGDPESASMIEVAHFIINSWNVFLN